jgi:hypothetical protein
LFALPVVRLLAGIADIANIAIFSTRMIVSATELANERKSYGIKVIDMNIFLRLGSLLSSQHDCFLKLMLRQAPSRKRREGKAR